MAIAAGVTTSLTISGASWIFVERPALRLKARFQAAGSGGKMVDAQLLC